MVEFNEAFQKKIIYFIRLFLKANPLHVGFLQYYFAVFKIVLENKILLTFQQLKVFLCVVILRRYWFLSVLNNNN